MKSVNKYIKHGIIYIGKGTKEMKTIRYYNVSSYGDLYEDDDFCINTLEDAVSTIEFFLSACRIPLKKSEVVKGGKYWGADYIVYDDEFEYKEEVDGYFNGRVWFTLNGTRYTAKTREDRKMGCCKLVYVREIR